MVNVPACSWSSEGALLPPARTAATQDRLFRYQVICCSGLGRSEIKYLDRNEFLVILPKVGTVVHSDQLVGGWGKVAEIYTMNESGEWILSEKGHDGPERFQTQQIVKRQMRKYGIVHMAKCTWREETKQLFRNEFSIVPGQDQVKQVALSAASPAVPQPAQQPVGPPADMFRPKPQAARPQLPCQPCPGGALAGGAQALQEKQPVTLPLEFKPTVQPTENQLPAQVTFVPTTPAVGLSGPLSTSQHAPSPSNAGQNLSAGFEVSASPDVPKPSVKRKFETVDV